MSQFNPPYIILLLLLLFAHKHNVSQVVSPSLQSDNKLPVVISIKTQVLLIFVDMQLVLQFFDGR